MNSLHIFFSVFILLSNKSKEFFFLIRFHFLCYFLAICLLNVIKYLCVSVHILLKVFFTLLQNSKFKLISSFFNKFLSCLFLSFLLIKFCFCMMIFMILFKHLLFKLSSFLSIIVDLFVNFKKSP